MRTGRLLLVAALFATPASAEPNGPSSAPPAYGGATTSGEAAVAEARALYDTGVRHYNVGDYDSAIESFRKAYLLAPKPTLLYNIAQAYRQKAPPACRLASQYYRAYLRDMPDAADKAVVQERIAAMDACAESESTKAPAPQPSAASDERGGSSRDEAGPPARAATPDVRKGQAAPFVLGALGVGLGAASGILYGLARARYEDLKEECPCPPERWQSWETVETVSYVLGTAGAVTLVTAIAWWILRPRDPSSAELRPMHVRF